MSGGYTTGQVLQVDAGMGLIERAVNVAMHPGAAMMER
jgi:hypothetical protein